MDYRPAGGIFFRPDINGNLTAYDTAGTVLAKFLSGSLSVKGNIGTVVTNTITFSTTSPITSSGVNSNFTPQISSRALILSPMLGNNSTAGQGSNTFILRQTGTSNPAGGNTSIGGTQILQAQFFSTNASEQGPLVIVGIDTGLTVGQAYTYILAFGPTSSGTTTLTNPNQSVNNILTVVEF